MLNLHVVTPGQNPVLDKNQWKLSSVHRKSKFTVLGLKPQSKNPAGFNIIGMQSTKWIPQFRLRIDLHAFGVRRIIIISTIMFSSKHDEHEPMAGLREYFNSLGKIYCDYSSTDSVFIILIYVNA